MCAAKESRGYLSARSKTRCILAAKLLYSLAFRHNSSNAKVAELKKTLCVEQIAKEPDLGLLPIARTLSFLVFWKKVGEEFAKRGAEGFLTTHDYQQAAR